MPRLRRATRGALLLGSLPLLVTVAPAYFISEDDVTLLVTCVQFGLLGAFLGAVSGERGRRRPEVRKGD